MRIAYTKANKSGIPNEYTELDYIGVGSSTTSYIDTHIWQTSDGKENTTTSPQYIDTEIMLSYTANATNRRLIGSSGYKTNYIGVSTSNYFEAGGSNTSTVKASLNTKYRVTSHQTATTFDFSVYNENGTLLGGKYGYTGYSGWDVTKAGESGHEANSTYNLFRIANWGTVLASTYTQIYVARYWIDGVLVGEFYPCKRNSDNVLGFYDTVTKTFFSNSGTGSFTAGNEVPPVSIPLLCYATTVRLPSEYQELEYIQTSGDGNTNGQYIDTGWKYDSSKLPVEIEASFMFTELSKGTVYGLQSSSYSNWIYPMYSTSGSTSVVSYIGNTSNKQFFTRSIGTKYNTRVTLTSNTVTRTVNDVTDSYSYTPNINTDASMFVFAGSHGTLVDDCTCIKMYSFSIKENGTLVRNFIPCKRLSDNAIGMYDTVTSTFYTNAGTGTFIAGNEIKPKLRFIETGV